MNLAQYDHVLGSLNRIEHWVQALFARLLHSAALH